MFRLPALAAAFALCAAAAAAPTSAPPKLDKARLEAYIRYAEAFTSDVQCAIDDPVPSAFPGYFRVVAHLTKGRSRLDRVYYVTPDGQRFINGNLWNLDASPFLDTLQHLPTNGPAFGPASAKVTIVVFSDFECPYCRELAKILRDDIPKNYPNDVRVVFEDFPIASIHPWARAAAEAGRCIADQSVPAFWAFHDWIFDHQQEVTPANLRDHALDLAKGNAVDPAKLSACIDSHATAPAIDSSLRAGEGLQIEQTPTAFINGRIVPGAVAWDQLNAIIQLELHRPAAIPAPRAEAPCCEVPIPRIAPQ